MDINRYSPSYGVNTNHLIQISSLKVEEIFEYLYAIKSLKAKFTANEDTGILRGVTIALLFNDTSLRTRLALEVGIRQLGGNCVNLPYDESDMRVGENMYDILNVICRYGVGALVTRGISKDQLKRFCADSPIPIINSNNDKSVPVQTLCDLFTIWEKRKKLEGLRLAYTGKWSANCFSLITGAVKCGMDVSLSTPREYAIPPELLESVSQYGNVTVTENPAQAVKNADVVYTDNYNYHTAISETERKILLPYQVNKKLMELASPDAVFMHALPANRGIEVTEEIIDGSKSLVLKQAENKLHTVKAVFVLLVK